MKYKELKTLNQIILSTREPGERQTLSPVVNILLPTQRYLIISSDPSSDTDKTKDPLEKHSGFEARILALMFYGSDDAQTVVKIRPHYKEYKELFFKNFYWTHFSKIYARGKPNSFWADKFLIKEVKLFEPECIIVFGSIVTDFLFGRGKFIDRINKVLLWNNIPTICCLHPSKDWNIRRRNEYSFYATWKLIRQKCKFYHKEEVEKLK
ncbi:MAG: hypothetical protein IB618_02430 [Candidatus Pacearchaeota archaeon]|nr:MAG: hypothetical protein IB618_02430 [Candidatus Pacearchaeota archaeon]